MTIIRKMQEFEVLHVERLLRDTWPDNDRVQRTVLREIEDMFSTAEYRPTFVVAEDHREIVGCGAWNWSWLNYGMYEILWGAVRPSHRGRGIGRRLVQFRLEDIRVHSKQEGEVCYAVLVATHHVMMYQRYGFHSIGMLPPAMTLDPQSHLMMLDG